MTNQIVDDVEQRAVDLTPTTYMIDNCKRGLEYHEQGKSGDGLKPQTVRDANNIADGQPLSIDKVTRMRAWIARHMVDLEGAPNPNDKEYPSPGQVAHLLWASGTNREQAQKTFDWCDQKMSQLEKENKRAANDPKTPAPPKDQIEGSDTNKPGSADNKTGGIELSEEVEKSLSNKVTKHNDEMKEKNKADWTRVTLGALRAVYRRGSGAFSGSHRPGMTRGQWALGRVNAFLYLAKNGKPENEKYVGDNDLLNKDHPKYAESKKRKIIMENETRQLPPSYRPSASEDVPVVRPSCMNCESSCAVVDPTQMVTITMCERWNAEIVLDQYCDAWHPKEDSEHEMESEIEMESMMGSEPGEIESMIEYDSQPTSTWVTRSVDDKRSLAFTNVECRAIGDGNTLVGYASMFDAPSHDLGGFTEYVARGAFTKTLKDGADVRLLIDHEGAPLARTKSNTMRLVEDERGLRVEADLDPSNPRAAEIISALKRGDMNQMSFAFRVIRDEWSKDRATRTLKEVRLFDVSVVTFPAYEATIAEIRNASIVDNDDPVVSKLNLRKRQVQIATILK
jgi:HK97 family phage prohead protease